MHCYKNTVLILPVLATGLLTPYAVANESMADGPLEEIVVTADKLNARSATETPFAIAVVGGSEIEEKGFTLTSELLRQTPGVFTDQVGGGTQSLNIRGIGNVLSADPTVGFYLDDQSFLIPQFNVLPDLNPYDLSHVEVLRGPQGTLYGASSLGGTVRIITNSPVHDVLEGKITGGYSTTDGGGNNYKLQGAINIPLIDETLSLRLTASNTSRDGYIDLPLTGETNHNDSEDRSYRVKARYTPIDKLEIGLSYWKVDSNLSNEFSEKDYTFTPQNQLHDTQTLLPTDTFTPVRANQLDSFLNYDVANLNASYTWTDYSLYVTASKMSVEYPFDGAFAVSPYRVANEFDVDSAELRLSRLGDSRLSWTTGAYYQDNHGKAPYLLTTYLDTTPLSSIELVVSDQQRSSTQWAVFGEVHYTIVPDTLVLTLGARYFEDQRTEKEASKDTITYASLLAEGFDTERSDTFDATTGRVNLSYTPDTDSLYYLNIAEGFRSGNIQCGACLLGGLAPPVTEPEDLISYELGGKVQFLDNTLLMDIALYYWEWDDIQLALTDFSPTGVPASFYANVGSAASAGLDLGVSYTGIEGLVLTLSGNVNNAEYTDDLPRAGIGNGDRVEMSAKYSVTASASYEWPIRDGLSGTVYAAYTAVDEVPTYNVFAPPLYSDGIDLLSARIGVRSEQWTVLVTAENLLNDDGIRNQQFVNLLLGGAPYYQQPRTIGLEISYQF